MNNTNGKLVILGLTGGISTGKSLVADMLKELGAEIIDADELGHAVMEPGGPACEGVRESFPASVMPDGRIDRTVLADIVFNYADKRALLEELTHPHIIDVMGQRIQAAISAGCKLIVVEAALIIEKGLDALFTGIVVVYTDEESQAARLSKRNGITADEAAKRIASQLPLMAKVARADYMIDNSGTIENTRAQVIKMFFDLSSPDTRLEKLRPIR